MSTLTAEEQAACDQYELMPPDTGAQLSYIIARLITRFTEYHGPGDDTIAQVRSAVGGALLEFNREAASQYAVMGRKPFGDVAWGSLA